MSSKTLKQPTKNSTDCMIISKGAKRHRKIYFALKKYAESGEFVTYEQLREDGFPSPTKSVSDLEASFDIKIERKIVGKYGLLGIKMNLEDEV